MPDVVSNQLNTYVFRMLARMSSVGNAVDLMWKS
jgi:hypothetical protein